MKDQFEQSMFRNECPNPIKKTMKLELKHLTPYLPYNLKMYWENLDGQIRDPYILLPSAIDHIIDFQNKPILRPLSDLTKEIEWEDGKYMMTDHDDFDLEEETYGVIQDYLSRHFDIFSLIPKGLAIDINTLDK